MKIIEKEISPADKTRIVFAVGKDELKLLHGLVIKALAVWPTGEDWKPEALRLRNISSAFDKYLKNK